MSTNSPSGGDSETGQLESRSALDDPHNTFATRHSEAQGDSGFLFQGWTLGGQVPQDKLWESLPWRGHNLIGSSPQRRGGGHANLKWCRELQVPSAAPSARPVENVSTTSLAPSPFLHPGLFSGLPENKKCLRKRIGKTVWRIFFLVCLFTFSFLEHVCVCGVCMCVHLWVCTCLHLDARGQYKCLCYCSPCSFLSQRLSSG